MHNQVFARGFVPDLDLTHGFFEGRLGHERIRVISKTTLQRTRPNQMKQQNKAVTKLSLSLVTAWAFAVSVEHAPANNLFGIAVSHYQGSINWSSVHSCGARYAFAKATEGVSYTDPNFGTYMNNGKGAGMQMGAYHFAHPANNCANAEADYFWSKAGGRITSDGKSLYPMVDFESFGGHACYSTYTAWFNAWANRVKSKTSLPSACHLCQRW